MFEYVVRSTIDAASGRALRAATQSHAVRRRDSRPAVNRQQARHLTRIVRIEFHDISDRDDGEQDPLMTELRRRFGSGSAAVRDIPDNSPFLRRF